MKTAFAMVTLLLTATAPSFAIPCGTVGTPTPCSITVGGTNTFNVTGFSFGTNAASGGGNLYQDEDINIDLVSGGGLTALLTFSKNTSGPTPGVVFFVNPGETSGFSFQYLVTLSAAVPGSVAYTSPLINSLNETHTNNALATIQASVPSAPPCLAFTNSTQANCTLPGGLGANLNVGEILSMNGNTGNTGVSSFSTLLSSSFSQTAVPEPASFVLLAAGLVALRLIRR